MIYLPCPHVHFKWASIQYFSLLHVFWTNRLVFLLDGLKRAKDENASHSYTVVTFLQMTKLTPSSRIMERDPAEEDYQLLCYKSQRLQCCNNANGFLVMYCVFAIVAGKLNDFWSETVT